MRFASFLSSWFITAIVVNPPEIKLAKRTSVLTASCWKENLSLDCPCESINKLSISLQIQVEDLIHFKGNVHKRYTIFWNHFWPPNPPPKIIYAHYLCTYLYDIHCILHQQRDWVGGVRKMGIFARVQYYQFWLMPYPCSYFYFDIKFGIRLCSKEKNTYDIICRQNWYQSKSNYMDRAYDYLKSKENKTIWYM